MASGSAPAAASICAPAGLEGFFRELAEADRAGALGPEAYASASANYG